jgi:hypothetical protein
MVHSGRCKHPALHLRYHLPGQLIMAPGGQKNCHIAGNHASMLVCIAVPGSTWEDQCRRQTLFQWCVAVVAVASLPLEHWRLFKPELFLLVELHTSLAALLHLAKLLSSAKSLFPTSLTSLVKLQPLAWLSVFSNDTALSTGALCGTVAILGNACQLQQS